MSRKIDLNTENQWEDGITPLSAYNLNVMLNGIIDNKNKSVETDQTYQPTSEKPQSGKAVKQALKDYLPLSGGTMNPNGDIKFSYKYVDKMIEDDGTESILGIYENNATFDRDSITFDYSTQIGTSEEPGVSSSGLTHTELHLVNNKSDKGEIRITADGVSGTIKTKESWKTWLGLNQKVTGLPFTHVFIDDIFGNGTDFELQYDLNLISKTLNNIPDVYTIFVRFENNKVNLRISNDLREEVYTDELSFNNPVFPIQFDCGVTVIEKGDPGLHPFSTYIINVVSFISKIDPIFANNSWETIAWVSKNDDPSKYWNVGDYKLTDVKVIGGYTYQPGIQNYSSTVFYIPDSDGLRPSTSAIASICVRDKNIFIKRAESCLSLDQIKDAKGTFYYVRKEPNDDTAKIRITNDKKTYNTLYEKTYDSWKELEDDWGLCLIKTDVYDNNNVETYGFQCPLYYGSPLYLEAEFNTILSQNTIQYPIMILGFNHDNVYKSDIARYGKSKAGMTLCLGVSREADKPNSPPYNHVNPSINPNIYQGIALEGFTAAIEDSNDGIYYLKSPYFNGIGESWGPMVDEDVVPTAFWSELQSFKENLTELKDYIIPVEKSTATGPYQPNNYYLPTVETKDELSLLSEYEIIGQSVGSAGKEGEQYEYFARGYSKFFWNDDMLTTSQNITTPKVARINLLTRSKIKGTVDEMNKSKGSICMYSSTSYAINKVGYGIENITNVTLSNHGALLPIFCL